MVTIDGYTGGSVATNGYLIQSGDFALVFDAPSGIKQWLDDNKITPDALLLTHQHFDHVEDVHAFDCPIYAYSQFDPMLIGEKLAHEWGLDVSVPDFTVDHVVADQTNLELGGLDIEVRYLPGHSPDSVIFYIANESIAIVGDTLFRGGVGRTDLPGGDHSALFDGISSQLMTLPDQTKLYPGHGPDTQPALESGFEAMR